MKNFGMDKLLHIVAAYFVLVAVAIALKGGEGLSNIVCASIGLVIAEVVLFAKEFYDKYIKRKFFDWWDIAWGQFGILAAFICAWIFLE